MRSKRTMIISPLFGIALAALVQCGGSVDGSSEQRPLPSPEHHFYGVPGGPFYSDSTKVTYPNTSSAALAVTTEVSAPWLKVTKVTPAKVDPNQVVTMSLAVDPKQAPTSPGVYTAALHIKGSGNNSVLATASVSLAITASPGNSKSPLGINLGGNSYYTPEWMFADAMMSAGDWLPQEVNSWVWNTKAPLSLTKDGWVAKLSPNQAAAKNVFRDMENGYPAGEYLVTYKGKGQLEFRGDGSVTSAGAGWIRLNVKPTMVGVILRLIKTDPADPLRDIRMWLPGYHDGKRLFFQQYLDRIAPFRFIRFMWPQGIVDSSRVKWADRVTPGYATQGGRDGVALEHLIDLANETMADAWFCVPHKADDDYVRRMAALVKARLDPGLRVYLEYSNEVWNGVYSQAKYCRDMGGKLNIPGDGFTKQMRFYSQRSVEIFDIWREVFGSSNRLVCVMATQSVNPWTANTVLQWKNAGAKSDALAIAPYFGNSLGSPNTMNVVQDYSVSKVLSECKKHLAVVAGDIRKNAAVAKKYGVSLISYEGGQHLVGVGRALDNKKLTELFIRVNRAPEMGQLTRQLLDDWKSGGGQEFCVFSFAYRPGKYGSWGILEHLFQPIQSAHKYRACLEFADSNPRWW